VVSLFINLGKLLTSTQLTKKGENKMFKNILAIVAMLIATATATLATSSPANVSVGNSFTAIHGQPVNLGKQVLLGGSVPIYFDTFSACEMARYRLEWNNGYQHPNDIRQHSNLFCTPVSMPNFSPIVFDQEF
jgi:hypothetical protein